MGFLSDRLSDMNIVGFIFDLKSAGIYNYVFPFILVYAIVFTILRSAPIKVFQNNKATQVIIAFIFAMFSVAFPINESGQTIGYLLSKLFPGVTAFTMGILALYIILAMLGVDLMKFFGDKDENNAWIKYILGGLGLFVVIFYYGSGFGWWGENDSGVLDWLIGSNGLLQDPLLYILIIFGALLWWIGSEDGSVPKNKDDNTTVNIGGDHH